MFCHLLLSVSLKNVEASQTLRIVNAVPLFSARLLAVDQYRPYR